MTYRAAKARQQLRGFPISQGGWGGWISDPSVIPPNSAYSQTSAGVVVNERSVVSLMSVFTCLRIIGDCVTALEPHTYMRGRRIGMPRVEVDPVPAVADPFADMSLRDGQFRAVTSLGLGGNYYRRVLDRDDRNLPALTDVVNPASVKVARVDGFKCYQINGKDVPYEDMVHVPWVALPGGLVGLNPIEIGSMGLGIAIASENFASRFFAQGTHSAGVLQIQKPMRQDDIERVRDQFITKHTGLSQAFGPIILDAAAQWTPISAITAETAQLLQSRAFSREEIAGFFGVPMYAMGDVADRGGTYLKGVQELLIAFAMFSLQGWAARLDEADTALCPPDRYVKRKVGDLFRTNDDILAKLITALRNSSTATPNELRPLVDLPPSTEPGADSLFAPMNSSQSDWMQPQAAPGSADDGVVDAD